MTVTEIGTSLSRASMHSIIPGTELHYFIPSRTFQCFPVSSKPRTSTTASLRISMHLVFHRFRFDFGFLLLLDLSTTQLTVRSILVLRSLPSGIFTLALASKILDLPVFLLDLLPQNCHPLLRSLAEILVRSLQSTDSAKFRNKSFDLVLSILERVLQLLRFGGSLLEGLVISLDLLVLLGNGALMFLNQGQCSMMFWIISRQCGSGHCFSDLFLFDLAHGQLQVSGNGDARGWIYLNYPVFLGHQHYVRKQSFLLDPQKTIFALKHKVFLLNQALQLLDPCIRCLVMRS
jgi:hypothetical protein